MFSQKNEHVDEGDDVLKILNLLEREELAFILKLAKAYLYRRGIMLN